MKSLISASNDSILFRELVFEKLNNKKIKSIDMFKKKEAARLSKETLKTDMKFMPILESGQLITSVNYKGQKKRHLKSKKGYIRQGTHYIPQTATQKVLYKMASRQRVRTINAKGSGFKRRMKFHIKLAWKRRKSIGLR